MEESGRLSNFRERYQSGEIPWDDELPPPELGELVGKLEPGYALDLGCGFGRSSIYLARHGWQVVGVDFVFEAIEEAKKRAEQADVTAKVAFYEAEVSDLSFLRSKFDLIIDIGCMHSLQDDELYRYRDELLRLMDNGGFYLLFAHLRDPTNSDEDEERWIEESQLIQLFTPDLDLIRVEHGTTQVEDKPPWHSAWFYFKKQ